MKICDDINNVREVMVGDISISDHTALFCVYKNMVRKNKMIEESKIRNYSSKLTNFISVLKQIFENNIDRYLNRFRNQRDRERIKNYFDAYRTLAQWGKRKRQAPERLNITSTKKKSYL